VSIIEEGTVRTARKKFKCHPECGPAELWGKYFPFEGLTFAININLRGFMTFYGGARKDDVDE
jgi:hypothetical protein